MPEGARGLELLVDVELDLAAGENCVVRCSLTEGNDDPTKAKTVSALLADPDGAPFQSWKAGVIEFARLLPQVSHREAAPSDRDPIPFPFSNTYNAPGAISFTRMSSITATIGSLSRICSTMRRGVALTTRGRTWFRPLNTLTFCCGSCLRNTRSIWQAAISPAWTMKPSIACPTKRGSMSSDSARNTQRRMPNWQAAEPRHLNEGMTLPAEPGAGR